MTTDTRSMDEKPKYTVAPQDPMDMLAEEGLEVAHERMKAIRFGWEGSPEWVARGEGSPRDRFIQEVGDFLVALDHAVAQGKIREDELEAAKEKKYRRLKELFGLERPTRRTQSKAAQHAQSGVVEAFGPMIEMQNNPDCPNCGKGLGIGGTFNADGTREFYHMTPSGFPLHHAPLKALATPLPCCGGERVA